MRYRLCLLKKEPFSGILSAIGILGGRNEELPVALFDSDSQGKATAKLLREGLYAAEPKLVLEVEPFTGLADSEIEDLLPPELLARELDWWQRGSDVPFADEMKAGTAIVPQIEAWAAKHKVELAKPGWKVELAKRVKQRLLADGPDAVAKDVLDRWENVFATFQLVRTTPTTAAKTP